MGKEALIQTIRMYYRMELYVLCINGAEWEDLVLFTSKEEAIEASKKYPQARVEIFAKSEKGGYHPTYNFYEKGVYIQNS